MDARDWFVILVVTAIWSAGTVYLFLHPDSTTFATWSGLAVTMTGFYHWMTIHDAKIADAP
jgi:hypothetical protein